jgi:hypothetical protein
MVTPDNLLANTQNICLGIRSPGASPAATAASSMFASAAVRYWNGTVEITG